MKTYSKWKLLAVAAMGVAAAGSANAAFVDYSIGDGGLESFTGNFDGQQIDGGSSFLAGGILITKQDGGAGLPDSLTTVCTDLGGVLYLGATYSYDAPVAFGPTTTGIAPPTWGTTPAFAAAAIQNAAYIYYTFGSVLNSGSTSQKAGLQLAVWEALYDTGQPLVVGDNAGYRFQVTGGDATAIADANFYLTGLTGNYNFPGYLLVPDPLSQQGQVAQELLIGQGDFTPAPEPGAYAAAASAGAFLCLLGMSRKQKRA